MRTIAQQLRLHRARSGVSSRPRVFQSGPPGPQRPACQIRLAPTWNSAGAKDVLTPDTCFGRSPRGDFKGRIASCDTPSALGALTRPRRQEGSRSAGSAAGADRLAAPGQFLAAGARPAARSSGTPRQQVFAAHLCKRVPSLALAHLLGGDFIRLIRQRQAHRFPLGLVQADPPQLPEFRGLVRSLQQDCDAVLAALHLPWSQGQVEGDQSPQVHQALEVRPGEL